MKVTTNLETFYLRFIIKTILNSQEGEILVTVKKLLNRIKLYQFSHSGVADSKI